MNLYCCNNKWHGMVKLIFYNVVTTTSLFTVKCLFSPSSHHVAEAGKFHFLCIMIIYASVYVYVHVDISAFALRYYFVTISFIMLKMILTPLLCCFRPHSVNVLFRSFSFIQVFKYFIRCLNYLSACDLMHEPTI